MSYSYHTPSTIVGAVVGTAGTTFPWWSDFISVATGANQWIIAIGGLVVLVLTIRKLITENKIASRRLRDLEKDGP